MTGAKVLAIGGITSSATVLVGGAANNTTVIGAAGAIMLLANLITLFVESKKK